MEQNLDDLLTRMNQALGGRQEGDLRLDDPYWNAREVYRLALNASGGVHHHYQPGVPYNKHDLSGIPVNVEVPVPGTTEAPPPLKTGDVTEKDKDPQKDQKDDLNKQLESIGIK